MPARSLVGGMAAQRLAGIGGEWPPPGVGILFWPGEKRLLQTTRLEQVRDGIEDWECCTMLDERLIRAYRAPTRYAAWTQQAEEEEARLRAGQVSPFTSRPSWGVLAPHAAARASRGAKPTRSGGSDWLQWVR